MNEDRQQLIFEQYKLASEMADRVSARRGTANSFFFTISAGLLSASESFELRLAAAAGVLLTATWWLQLRSYRNLNAAKWAVINKLEAELPARPFEDEWALVKREPVERVVLRSARLGKMVRPLARYAELSLVEQVVPAIFALLFIIAFVT